VGVDQVPHLEITREIARRFNHLYKKEILPEPEPLLTEYPKVTGLDGRKMSKSYENALYLNDPPEVVEKKILTMVTDVRRVRRTDPGVPEDSPVYQLHKIFSSEEELKEVAEGCRTASIGCKDCKRILIENVFGVLEPIWEKRKEFSENPGLLSEIIEQGVKRATRVARETMTVVRETLDMY
jgi:tryptophanyl-tRNA synthetase